MISIARVEMGIEEIDAAVSVLKSGRLVYGKKTAQFEKDFAKKTGAGYALSVSSGTAALHTAFLATINQGDEVLVPSFSHISTASMVCFAGGKPVFCDVDPKTFTIDLEEVRKRITKKTRAIVPVHLFGNAGEIDEIVEIAKEFELFVVWDAAQALGTRYKRRDIGSYDDTVCFSFYATKNITTGEGGMITTGDKSLYERMKLIRSHGQTEKYCHTLLGLNYRMTEVQAAIGIEQLKKLDNMIEKRRANAELLNRRLADVVSVSVPFVQKYVDHSYHQYSILLDTRTDRDGLGRYLTGRGIGCAVHYPRGIHDQPVFQDRFGEQRLQNTEYIAQRILSVPIHHGLDESEIEQTADTIRNYWK